MTVAAFARLHVRGATDLPRDPSGVPLQFSPLLPQR